MEEILLVGGDKRRTSLAKYLEDKGFSVIKILPGEGNTFELKEKLEKAKLVVLPVPVMSDEYIFAPLSERELKARDLVDLLHPNLLLLGGRMTKDFMEMLDEKKIRYIDYYNREELSVYNAIPTAEGAVRIAMQEMPVTIHGTKILIIGFGRVGKVCADRFSAMGADVTVAARSIKDRAWVDSFKMKATEIKDIEHTIEKVDLVINTVPALVLNRNILEHVKKDCLIIDLASKPGGVDFAASAEMGIKTIWALSLPGKEAPVTAGSILGDAIYNIIREIGK